GGLPDADIDATEAWDHTTGGLTPAGDTIVVAVIDDGTDPDHPDLAANLWRNYAEIPYNNIDDDDNGYIDDHWGWNVSAGIDLVQFGSHGVKVSGLIGAVGDNQTGIAGVNWDVKILNVVGITNVESEV
ncbi:MAG: S8 family serine peptidase, partial [Saprospiraceae bacterium]|nr:S8 family serine peptidase [Saprospiraceae bacterium]